MSFLDTNVADGLPANAKWQYGISDADSGATAEQSISIPWSSEPDASFLYFDCTVSSVLDSGIVVHNRLPQYNKGYDTLASCNLDDDNMGTIMQQGVNLKCMDQYQDIVQRMGHARYWFRIWGQALRAGYQIPIPGIKTIGGVPAIPYDKNPQWAFNRILPGGNYSGVILWHAKWSLWYTTAVPPTGNQFPAADPSTGITGATLPTPPTGMQAPFSQPDDNAQSISPPITIPAGNIIG